MQSKKSRNVETLSPVHTADVVIEVGDDQLQLNSELGTGTTAGSKIITKNKSRLSEMDSGILMEEVEDHSTTDLAAQRKVSSRGASDKQESSATLATKPSQNESSSSNRSAHTCHVKFVTVSSQNTVETLQEKSSGSSCREPMASDSLSAASDGNLRNWSSEVHATDVKELPNAKTESEFLRKEMKKQQSEKKCARNEVVKQKRCAPSCSRYTDSNKTTENDGGGGGDDDNLIVIYSSDADEPEPASDSNQMALSNLHTDAGIVI